MKNLLFFFLLFSFSPCTGQENERAATKDVELFQQALNKEYKDPKKSPLEAKALRRFKKHDFFPVDVAYRVRAELEITENTPFFAMKTTTDRLPQYRKYGIIRFALKGIDYELPVYQSQDLMHRKEYEDYLFLPFTDLTNGKESYSGGRYVELRIPKDGNDVLVDFNKAYNPYCAYSARFSCPLVPQENNLPVEIRAGVRYVNGKK